MVTTAPAGLPVAGGPRAWLVGLTVLAGLYTLSVSGTSGGNGAGYHGGTGGVSVKGALTIDIDGSGWWDVGLVAAAAMLMLAAILLWVARRPATLVLTLALLAAGPLVGLAADRASDRAGHVSRSEARSIALGTSEDELRRRLGAPAGHGVWSRGERRDDCLVYLDEAVGEQPRRDAAFSYCLVNERVALRDIPPP